MAASKGLVRPGTDIERFPGGQLAATGTGAGMYAAPGNTVQLSPSAVTPSGGDAPHNNLMPYLTFYFCIALQGVFPPRP